MRVIASIEDPKVIRSILEHLRLWLANAGSEPRAHSPPVHPFSPDAFFSQLPASSDSSRDRIPDCSHCVFRILSLTHPAT